MSGDELSGVRSDIGRWIVVAATAATTFALGATKIGRSFGYDEAMTYASFVNGGSPTRALTTQVVFNNHQLFSVVQAVAWRMGLVGETSQRLLPVLCGTATVAILSWWLARRSGLVTGLLGGLLLALNPVYLAEFRTLRGYALATLATLVAAIVTERSWSDHRLRWLIASGAAMTVAVTTHAYSVVPLSVVAVVTIALGQLRRDHVVTWIAAALAAVVIQLPLLDDALRESSNRGSRYQPQFVQRTVEAYLGDRSSAIVLMAILLVAGGWSLARRSARYGVALGSAVGVVALVVLVLWQVVRPYDLYPRFFVTLTPFLAALAAFGAQQIPRGIGTALAAVLVITLVPGALDTVRREPTLRMAATVITAARAADLEVCGAFTSQLRIYARPVREIYPMPESGSPDFGDCDVFVRVLGIDEAGRAAASERFEARTPLGGGIDVYSSDDFRSTVLAIRDA